MAYTALYRKFRPQEFEDVKGQEHIVTTLCNQIKADRIGHAYLFCGTRGTGKTTIAKIFAKAVNCSQPVDGSPCGTCPSCRAIQEGNSMNVIEIDAASNNGVDNIREIREEVAYSPAEGKYKVYIIDEVHMLSMGAFNALLKTLEEPPSYVIFILATTEAHKIPVTILSRCQRYDFRRITIDTISKRLMELVLAEQVQAQDKAIRYIAKAGDGSMRDAISLLDRCIAFYLGQELTYDKVLDVLGAVDSQVFGQMLRLIAERNIAGLIATLEEMMIQGREPGQFVTDFTWYLRNLLLLKSSDDMEEVLDVSSENLKEMRETASVLTSKELMRYIHIFSQLSNQIRYASQKRILIEIALIKLCRPQMEENLEALTARIDDLERKLEQGVISYREKNSDAQDEKGTDGEPQGVSDTPTISGKSVLPKAIPEEVQQVVTNWRSIIQSMSGSLRTFLKGARLSLGKDNELLILFEDELAESYVNTQEHRQEISNAISAKTGREVEIQILKNESRQNFADAYVDIEKMIHMDLVIEDD